MVEASEVKELHDLCQSVMDKRDELSIQLKRSEQDLSFHNKLSADIFEKLIIEHKRNNEIILDVISAVLKDDDLIEISKKFDETEAPTQTDFIKKVSSRR